MSDSPVREGIPVFGVHRDRPRIVLDCRVEILGVPIRNAPVVVKYRVRGIDLYRRRVVAYGVVELAGVQIGVASQKVAIGVTPAVARSRQLGGG